MTHQHTGREMHDDPATIKILFNSIIIGVSYVFAYAGLATEQMMAYTVLIAMDYITGFGKAWHIGQPITYKRMWYGVVAKASLLLVPVALGIGSKATGLDFGMAITMFINMLIVAEVYSIISNVYAIRNGKELPEYDVLAIVARHVREYLIKKGE